MATAAAEPPAAVCTEAGCTNPRGRVRADTAPERRTRCPAHREAARQGRALPGAKPAAPATCDHPDGCARPRGKVQANTRPERAGWCREHRLKAAWNTDRRGRKGAPGAAASAVPAARKLPRAASPVPARANAAPAAASPDTRGLLDISPNELRAMLGDRPVAALVEAHDLVQRIGLEVCRGLAARIGGGER